MSKVGERHRVLAEPSVWSFLARAGSAGLLGEHGGASHCLRFISRGGVAVTKRELCGWVSLEGLAFPGL